MTTKELFGIAIFTFELRTWKAIIERHQAKDMVEFLGLPKMAMGVLSEKKFLHSEELQDALNGLDIGRFVVTLIDFVSLSRYRAFDILYLDSRSLDYKEE